MVKKIQSYFGTGKNKEKENFGGGETGGKGASVGSTGFSVKSNGMPAQEEKPTFQKAPTGPTTTEQNQLYLS